MDLGTKIVLMYPLGRGHAVENPNKKAYTFRRGSYSSRLDYFLVSSHLTSVTDKVDSTLVASSDHDIINITLSMGIGVDRGPGFWRFNPELLTNPSFVSEMETGTSYRRGGDFMKICMQAKKTNSLKSPT